MKSLSVKVGYGGINAPEGSRCAMVGFLFFVFRRHAAVILTRFWLAKIKPNKQGQTDFSKILSKYASSDTATSDKSRCQLCHCWWVAHTGFFLFIFSLKKGVAEFNIFFCLCGGISIRERTITMCQTTIGNVAGWKHCDNGVAKVCLPQLSWTYWGQTAQMNTSRTPPLIFKWSLTRGALIWLWKRGFSPKVSNLGKY